MLEHIVLLLGLAFLFLYFAFKLEKSHYILKLFLIFAFFFLIILAPYALIDDNCTLVVANETVSGSVTLMEYEQFCDSTVSETELRTFKITNFSFLIFGIYFFIYLVYEVLLLRIPRFTKWISKRRK